MVERPSLRDNTMKPAQPSRQHTLEANYLSIFSIWTGAKHATQPFGYVRLQVSAEIVL